MFFHHSKKIKQKYIWFKINILSISCTSRKAQLGDAVGFLLESQTRSDSGRPLLPQMACPFKELEFPHWRQTSYSMGEDYFSEVGFQEREVGLTVVWQLWPQSLLPLFIILKLFSSNCEQPLMVGNCPKRPETQVCPPRRWKVASGGTGLKRWAKDSQWHCGEGRRGYLMG